MKTEIAFDEYVNQNDCPVLSSRERKRRKKKTAQFVSIVQRQVPVYLQYIDKT